MSIPNPSQTIRVSTNLFQLQWPEKGLVYHYDVVMTPLWEVKVTKDNKERTLARPTCTEVMNRLQLEVAPKLFHPKAAYDGKKNLYAFRRYDLSAQEFHVPLDSKPNPRREPRVVSVKVAFVNVISVRNLQTLLSRGRPNQQPDNDASTALNMLNVFIQAAPRMEHPRTHNARSFFSPYHKVASRGFELWRGYFQSVRPSVDKLLINVDVTVGVIVPACPLDHFIQQLMGRGSRQPDPGQFQEIRHIVKSIKVIVDLPNHQGMRPREIKDLIMDVGQITFDMNGQKVSVRQYWKNAHNRDILPNSLGIRFQKGDIFPIQVCKTIEQLYKPRPPSFVISDALRFTPENPERRLRAIQDGWEQLKYPSSIFLSGAGMQVRPDPMEVNGRVLPAPQIEFGSKQVTNIQRLGVWDVVHKRLYKPAVIQSWVVIDFSMARNGLNEFFIEFFREMGDRGISAPQPRIMRHDAGRLHEVLNQLARERHDLVVAVLPERAADLYLAIKRFGDIQRGVATQCIKWTSQRENSRGRNQYINNVLLKVNARLGGINFAPRSGITKPLTESPTMILGADVSHPGPGSYLPSTTALVASLDPDFSKYKAFVRIQSARTEMISKLEEMAKLAIQSFADLNKTDVHRIFYYRDGVSEGEFEQVKELEIGALRRALRAVHPKPDRVKLVVLVVGKRHHVRFFPKGRHGQGIDEKGNGNLLAGFVADQDINHPSYDDFYLQSQPGLKGTSIPAHYTILLNEVGVPPRALQDISYTLCHTYSRSTRSVKVPAPVYYADLVCRRAKFHYEDHAYSETMSVDSNEPPHIDHFLEHFKQVNQSMENSMYFV